LNQRLEAAQAKTQGLLDTLDWLEHQSSQDKQRATALEAKVTDLARLLHDREGALDQQQELLAHDRDIRELMGARDLYIAEVYDVTWYLSTLVWLSLPNRRPSGLAVKT